MGNWQDQAKRLYFEDKLSIVAIAAEVEKTRKTVSVFLQELDGFEEEKERRKAVNQAKRPEYKRKWEKKNKSETTNLDGVLLKKQHFIDVAVLSYERI